MGLGERVHMGEGLRGKRYPKDPAMGEPAPHPPAGPCDSEKKGSGNKE